MYHKQHPVGKHYTTIIAIKSTIQRLGEAVTLSTEPQKHSPQLLCKIRLMFNPASCSQLILMAACGPELPSFVLALPPSSHCSLKMTIFSLIVADVFAPHFEQHTYSSIPLFSLNFTTSSLLVAWRPLGNNAHISFTDDCDAKIIMCNRTYNTYKPAP